jgi:hypothetical protein
VSLISIVCGPALGPGFAAAFAARGLLAAGFLAVELEREAAFAFVPDEALAAAGFLAVLAVLRAAGLRVAAGFLAAAAGFLAAGAFRAVVALRVLAGFFAAGFLAAALRVPDAFEAGLREDPVARRGFPSSAIPSETLPPS